MTSNERPTIAERLRGWAGEDVFKSAPLCELLREAADEIDALMGASGETPTVEACPNDPLGRHNSRDGRHCELCGYDLLVCEHKWERSANRDSEWVGYGLPYEYCGSCGAERAMVAVRVKPTVQHQEDQP